MGDREAFVRVINREAFVRAINDRERWKAGSDCGTPECEEYGIEQWVRGKVQPGHASWVGEDQHLATWMDVSKEALAERHQLVLTVEILIPDDVIDTPCCADVIAERAKMSAWGAVKSLQKAVKNLSDLTLP